MSIVDDDLGWERNRAAHCPLPRQQHPRGRAGAAFLPFRRSESVGRSVPGAGVGQPIAEVLVDAQSERIDLESQPSRQAWFWIALPLAA